MSNELEKTLSIVFTEIKNTVAQFRRQPFDAAYESDLRSYLYAKLFDAFSDCAIDLRSRLKPSSKEQTENWLVNPVRTEYPTTTRFDLALLDPVSQQHEMTQWNQPVRFAIEVKYWQFDGTGGSFKMDLRKLAEYQEERRSGLPFCGIALLFVQPGYNWGQHAPAYKRELEPCERLNTGIWLHVVEMESEKRGWQCVKFTPELNEKDQRELFQGIRSR